MKLTRDIPPTPRRRTCQQLGACIYPTSADCCHTCQQPTGAELPTPTLPFEVDGPYRRESSHRLNRAERLAFRLMVVTSFLTGCALLYVVCLALISAGGLVGEWLRHILPVAVTMALGDVAP